VRIADFSWTSREVRNVAPAEVALPVPRASTQLRWSFGQPGLPQSFFESREIFGTPIRAHYVF
jgi:hypothetical protein